jgi:hypothetical protein
MGKFIPYFKAAFSERFEIEDLGPATWLLGCRIHRNRENRTLEVGQEHDVSEIINKFGMTSSTPIGTPMVAKVVSKPRHDEPLDTKMFPFPTLVGKLVYNLNCTRPDITVAVNHLSRYMSKCTLHHWDQAKRILRYLNGTRTFCLTFNVNISSEAIMWHDSSFGDGENMRSRTGFLAMVCGGPVV